MQLSPLVAGLGATLCLVVGFFSGRLILPVSSEPQVPKSISKGSHVYKTHKASFLENDPEQVVRNEITKRLVDQNSAIVQLALDEWCVRDPQGALAFCLESGRDDWLRYCLGIYGRANTDEAISWIEMNTRDMALKNSLVSAVYQGLAIEDPQLAIQHVNDLPQGPMRNQILQIVVAEWGLSDVHGVFDWIETQTPSPLLSAIYGQAMTSYIIQSPEEAIKLISNLSDNTDKLNFSSKAAFELAKKDPQKAVEWITTLDAKHKHSAQMGLMEQWGKSQGATEAIKYIQNLPENSQSSELLSMLTMKMAHSSPNMLADEIPSLTIEQQKIAATQLARAYSNTTPDEVIPWLETLDSPEVRDTAIITTLSNFRHTNVSQAFDLSTSLYDYNKRRDEVQKTLLEWIPTDPLGAMKALSNSSLSDDLKQAIAKNIEAQSPQIKDILLPAR